MKKLFSNVGGNQFKLLTESVDKPILKESKETLLLREAIKKMFTNGEGTLKYAKLENMGIGFIKNIFEAKKVALQEARVLAEEFGYNDNGKEFVKEAGMTSENDETDMSNPEESREVQIGREILRIAGNYGIRTHRNDLPEEVSKLGFTKIAELANELIQMHGQK